MARLSLRALTVSLLALCLVGKAATTNSSKSSTIGTPTSRGDSLDKSTSLTALAGASGLECGKRTSKKTLLHGGFDRTYRLFVPSTVCKHDSQPTKAPLVIFLHCFGCSCERDTDSWTLEAEKRGAVLARPCGDAAKGPPSWNAGACCGGAVRQKLDDVGFVQAVVHDIIAQGRSASSRVEIDETAIYLTGFSNGGYMSSILARESSLFRKVAPVSGYEYDMSETLSNSTALSSVPIQIHHGLKDRHVNPAGCCRTSHCCCSITWSSCVSLFDFYDKWGRINRCHSNSTAIPSLPAPSRPTREHEQRRAAATPDAGAARQRPSGAVCTPLLGCKAPTELCLYPGKGHVDVLRHTIEHIVRFFFD